MPTRPVDLQVHDTHRSAAIARLTSVRILPIACQLSAKIAHTLEELTSRKIDAKAIYYSQFTQKSTTPEADCAVSI